jgi:hypothetical protein
MVCHLVFGGGGGASGGTESPGSAVGVQPPGPVPSLSEEDRRSVGKILAYTMKDSSFRKGLALDPARTIEIYRSKLGFGPAELSEHVLDVIGSFTDEELKVLTEITRRIDVTPREGGEEAGRDPVGAWLF